MFEGFRSWIFGCAGRVSLFRQPSNHREWSPDVAVFPEISFEDGETVVLKNIRHFVYRSVSEYTPGYYDRTFRLSQIENAWFLVEPFSLIAAHTFVSFGLRDGTYIAVSIEIRKRMGQSFSELLILFFLRRHELIYVIGDEHDLIKLRTNYRKDRVYLYPVQATPEQARKFFVDVMERARCLQEHPEFYNPFTNTCLTNLVTHVNNVVPGHIRWSYKIWIATYADELAYATGLLGRILPFSRIKKQCYINDRALEYADAPDFSQKIRQGIGT